MNKKEKPIRPFSLEYAEAKSKIIGVINEAVKIHGVPFYLLEEIITDISYQVKESARAEREQAERAYQRQLAEYEGETKE